MAKPAIDTEKFRLRRFVDELVALGEVEIHDQPVPLSDLSLHIENTAKASLFLKAGPEQAEIVGGVMGSRTRMARAFGVGEKELAVELSRRLATPSSTIEIPSADAPVHEVILEGADADFMTLPFHVQHQLDGGPYISSAIDYTVDPQSGKTNVGCRRIMLRGRHDAGVDVTAPSDLKQIYAKCIERGERLPISFAVGCHPLDFVASMLRIPGDEVGLVGSLRGEPLPVAKCVTNDIFVPADAEMILEGYFDERGYVEEEGPYGEYMGFYGPMHPCPTFHLTAITKRRDALFQTILHGSGKHLGRTEGPNFGAIILESQAWNVLKATVGEPVAVHAKPSANGLHHLYASIRQKAPGEGRAAIQALLDLPIIKHVYVTDAEVDIFDEDQMHWAMSSRFQADRDLIVEAGKLAMGMDPSLGDSRTGARAGFDLTLPPGVEDSILAKVPEAPRFTETVRFQTIKQALETGPMYFARLMEAVGSRDGREVMAELEELRLNGNLRRLRNGEYALVDENQ